MYGKFGLVLGFWGTLVTDRYRREGIIISVCSRWSARRREAQELGGLVRCESPSRSCLVLPCALRIYLARRFTTPSRQGGPGC